MIFFKKVIPPEGTETVVKKFAFLPTNTQHTENGYEVHQTIWLESFYEKTRHVGGGYFRIFRQRNPFQEPLKVIK